VTRTSATRTSATRTSVRQSNAVRQPAVAGRFYPADPAELAAMVDSDVVARRQRWRRRQPDARLIGLVVPHAGYVFSGLVAGAAYALLDDDVRARVASVLLLGPAHYVPVRGIAVPSVSALRTPLGDLPVASDLRERVLTHHDVTMDDYAHEPEHSLEVQLPFLQRCLPGAAVLPCLVGLASPDEVADVLSLVWSDPSVLVVVSTDLSHYLDLAACRRRDAATVRAVEALDAEGVADDDACGARPLRGLLRQARRTGARIAVVDQATSADAIGPADRVVGYGSFAVWERASDD
jgi:AmmeMemoRadiSam system protein B